MGKVSGVFSRKYSWKREGEEAVKLISEKIKEADGPFLRFCEMPSTDDIGEVNGVCKSPINVPNSDWALNRQKGRLQSHSIGAKTKNIFGTKSKSDAKNTHGTYVELAHAAPQDLACSIFWPYFLQILTGESEGSKWQRFCAVHGLVSNENKADDDAYKYQGVKNLLQNLLALPPGHHGFFYGTHAGNLIIVPIIDLDSEDVKGLYGIKSRYSLLVVGRSESVYSWIYNGKQPARRNLLSKQFDEFVEDATEPDILVATKFLATYVRAAVFLGLETLRDELPPDQEKSPETATSNHSTVSHDACKLWLEDAETNIIECKYDNAGEVESGQSIQTGSGTSKNCRKKCTAIRKALDKMVEKDGYFCVPELMELDRDEIVMKVNLSTFFQRQEIDEEFYPAWSLVGLKSTANWCKYTEHPFITSCRDHASDPDHDAFSLSSVEASQGSVSELSNEEWEEESMNDPYEVRPACAPESPQT